MNKSQISIELFKEKLDYKPIMVGKEKMQIDVGIYGNGRPCLNICSYFGEPYGKLTVNLSDIKLKDTEICVKGWAENEKLIEAARATGYFKDTGRRIKTGFVEAEVWEVI